MRGRRDRQSRHVVEGPPGAWINLRIVLRQLASSRIRPDLERSMGLTLICFSPAGFGTKSIESSVGTLGDRHHVIRWLVRPRDFEVSCSAGFSPERSCLRFTSEPLFLRTEVSHAADRRRPQTSSPWFMNSLDGLLSGTVPTARDGSPCEIYLCSSRRENREMAGARTRTIS